MQERRLHGAIVSVAILVMACGSVSGTPTGSASPSPTASLGGGAGGSNPAPSASSSPTGAPSASVAPTASLSALDPCGLLTESEASTLIGTTVRHSQGGGAGTKAPCVYSDSAHDSVAVAIRVAPDAAAAVQLMSAERNSQSTEGFTVTTLTGIGDMAYEAKNKTGGINTDGIYVLQGVTFFYITTLSKSLDPSDDAFKTAAGVALGHL